jgi:NADH:ubiquinone oxidoreductase subunit C
VNVLPALRQKFLSGAVLGQQTTRDEIPTFWIKREAITAVLRYLKEELSFAMLYDDLTLPTIIHLWPNANWYEREV